MDDKIYLTLSVHGLVDFLLRRGDIDNRIYNNETMQMGTKIHASYQEKQGRQYLSEVVLRGVIDRPAGVLTLEGRADGIIEGGAYPIIDEIKSTVAPLEEFYEQQKDWHLGQAKCYALLYARAHSCREVGIWLTYIHQVTGEQIRKEFLYKVAQIEQEVNEMADQYLEFFASVKHHEEVRNESVVDLEFPFPGFRPGQREMAKRVYRIARDGGRLFIEAPTGIGKTISALYPAVKTFEKGQNERIFYLTAKTTGRQAAYDALTRLYEKGFAGRDSMLRAKDKMCFCPGASCDPDNCPFTKGYYDKLPSVRKEALESQNRFSEDYVSNLAAKYLMCPFELQLDLSLWSDIIICDYNYLFDPIVYLERFFDPLIDNSKTVVLVDEAHNLIDRGRSMYGSALPLSMVVEAKKSLSRIKCNGVKRALTKLIHFYEQEIVTHELPYKYESFPNELLKRIDAIDRAEKNAMKDAPFKIPLAYRDFSRESHRLVRLVEGFDANTVTYLTPDRDDIVFHFDSLDPSPYLSDVLARIKSTVFFSATFSPIEFYQEGITGEAEDPTLLLHSPFPPENICLTIVPNLSVRYKDREMTYEDVAEYLRHFVAKKTGNYFLYFPSYEYLDKIADYLDFGDAEVHRQTRQMTEGDRIEFLGNFSANPQKTTIGLLILGGAFSEGIDLVGDRLSGVAIVGIGMPQISFERNLLREFFDAKEKKGFAFAYLYPGINRAMQALGRLIRSENDVGAALLIDDRYLQREYRSIYARIYPRYQVATSTFDLDMILDEFYEKKHPA